MARLDILCRSWRSSLYETLGLAWQVSCLGACLTSVEPSSASLACEKRPELARLAKCIAVLHTADTNSLAIFNATNKVAAFDGQFGSCANH
jgi:hypothetical protein